MLQQGEMATPHDDHDPEAGVSSTPNWSDYEAALSEGESPSSLLLVAPMPVPRLPFLTRGPGSISLVELQQAVPDHYHFIRRRMRFLTAATVPALAEREGSLVLGRDRLLKKPSGEVPEPPTPIYFNDLKKTDGSILLQKLSASEQSPV